jgi:hypothetical protein
MISRETKALTKIEFESQSTKDPLPSPFGKIVGASKVRTAAKSVVKSMSWCRYPGIRPIGGFQDWARGGQNGTVPKAEPWLIPKSFF